MNEPTPVSRSTAYLCLRGVARLAEADDVRREHLNRVNDARKAAAKALAEKVREATAPTAAVCACGTRIAKAGETACHPCREKTDPDLLEQRRAALRERMRRARAEHSRAGEAA